ncbi:MAG TPA: hypothetical protein VFB38_05070 [Chthonomonadaceae bacterium]|nr:hypothetical protein [Chthonomonadaceae bacterium]
MKDVFAFIRSRLRLTLILACAALILGLWAAQVTPFLNPADDAGRYMVLGESLAKTGDLRLLNDARRPLDTLYPPGFPALIAFWLLATGREPGGVVLLVKLTQVALLIAALPLLSVLLERARLPFAYRAAALLTAALCPALIAFANEVMSEIPFLFLCLASVVLIEDGGKRANEFAATKARSHPTATKDLTPDPSPSKGEGSGSPSRLFGSALSTLIPGPSPSKGEGPAEAGALPSLARNELVGKGDGGLGTRWVRPALSLLYAAAAFLVRTAAVALLLVEIVWLWRRYGWKWGVAALLVALAVVGGWQLRNRRIILRHPEIRYSTYADQFFLRDPMRPGAGRIDFTAHDLASRAYHGMSAYTGMIPRALLNSMSLGTPWFYLFYLVAVPLTLLILIGFGEGWRRGLILSGAFTALFWLFAAMWPWRNPRFLIPLLPFFILYLYLGVERASHWLQKQSGTLPTRLAQGVGALLLLAYFGHVHAAAIRAERSVTTHGYALGRTPEEGGFYAACDWLRRNAPFNAVVMGRPQYLVHLYSGHPTVQIEPAEKPRAQAWYVRRGRVRYILEDAWDWAHSHTYLDPYLREYASQWRLAWQDPRGSGVCVWEWVEAPAPPAHSTDKAGFPEARVL